MTGRRGPSRGTATARPSRVDEVVAAARRVVDRDGPQGLTMRSVADELRIKAPSLYKHVAGKAAIEVELMAATLAEMGEALHAVLAEGGSTAELLATYRREARTRPNMYRLATTGTLPRDELPPGLEDWAGEPFLTVTGEPHRAQALWAFAHGMVILELDGRFAADADLDRTWAEGAAAFTR